MNNPYVCIPSKEYNDVRFINVLKSHIKLRFVHRQYADADLKEGGVIYRINIKPKGENQ